jgi:hypothetical protein
MCRWGAFSGRLALLLLAVFGPVAHGQTLEQELAIDIGARLELFVDEALIDWMDGAELMRQRPQKQPAPASPLPVPYTTVIKDGDLYRAWYRAIHPDYEGKRFDGHPGEMTAYAESEDGREWRFPDLGIVDARSAWGGNMVLYGASPASHNFTPFIDVRPGVDPGARYKALGGTHPGGGLYAYQSADGIHWDKMQDDPVMTSEDFAFDSQNASFWCVVENQYVCFIRTWKTPHGELRTISRSVSDDFLNWSKPVPLLPNRAGEHLYTNATQPYFRAPHIYLAFPTRFFPDRGDSTDILFMATRAGSRRYGRLFTEPIIVPGLDPDRWGNRSNYVALGLVPTGPGELSLYHKSGHRYTLRTDGFVSVHAGSEAGELVTRPIIFEGDDLVLNCRTSAAGSLRVELLDANGRSLPGFALDDCREMTGDAISHVVEWNGGARPGQVAGTAVRIRFVMTECDLFSFRFQSNEKNGPND